MKAIWKTQSKRLLIGLLLAALVMSMVFSLAACGKSQKEESSIPDSAVITSPSVEPTATPEPAKTTIATIKQIDDFLNIRDQPSTKGKIIGRAKTGDQFEVVMAYCDATRGWHEINFADGLKGRAYVSAEYTTISEGVLEGSTSTSTAPQATPNADQPIVVNGSGRPNVESSAGGENADNTSSSGLNADTLRDDEDGLTR